MLSLIECSSRKHSARTYMLPVAHLIQTDRSSIPWIVSQLLLVSSFHADMYWQQEQILLLKYTYWSIIATYMPSLAMKKLQKLCRGIWNKNKKLCNFLSPRLTNFLMYISQPLRNVHIFELPPIFTKTSISIGLMPGKQFRWERHKSFKDYGENWQFAGK